MFTYAQGSEWMPGCSGRGGGIWLGDDESNNAIIIIIIINDKMMLNPVSLGSPDTKASLFCLLLSCFSCTPPLPPGLSICRVAPGRKKRLDTGASPAHCSTALNLFTTCQVTLVGLDSLPAQAFFDPSPGIVVGTCLVRRCLSPVPSPQQRDRFAPCCGFFCRQPHVAHASFLPNPKGKKKDPALEVS